jgi:hypothetical protein
LRGTNEFGHKIDCRPAGVVKNRHHANEGARYLSVDAWKVENLLRAS